MVLPLRSTRQIQKLGRPAVQLLLSFNKTVLYKKKKKTVLYEIISTICNDQMHFMVSGYNLVCTN